MQFQSTRKYLFLIITGFCLMISACRGETGVEENNGPYHIKASGKESIGTLEGTYKLVASITEDVEDVLGVGVILDNGEYIEAMLPEEILEKPAPGLRVRVVEGTNSIFEWVVIEAFPETYPTAEIFGPVEPECELSGAFMKTSNDASDSALEEIGQLLSEEMGCRINMQFTNDNVFPEIFLSGEVDFMLMRFGDVYDSMKIGLTPILIAEQEVGTYFRGAFFTRVGESANSLADFEGRSFAYVDKNSNFGYLLPRVMLAQQGFDVNSFFSETISAGYDIEYLTNFVRNGDVDLGITFADESTDGLQWLANNDPSVTEALKIIDYTPWIPNKGILVYENMDTDLQEKLAKALMAISETSAGRQALQDAAGVISFIQLDDDFNTLMTMFDQAEQLDREFGIWE